MRAETLAGEPRRGEAGLSMIELVIATLLFFLIIMGLLPLFTRSAINNAMGNSMTLLSNQSKSRAEEYYQAGFNSPPLTIPAGSTDVTITDFWDATHEAFGPDPPADGSAPRFTRTTRVRQYNLADLEDGVPDTPLDGNASPANVHLKEIEVTVVSRDVGPISGRRIFLRTLKPF